VRSDCRAALNGTQLLPSRGGYMEFRVHGLIGPALLVALLAALAGLAMAYPSMLWAGDDYSLQYLAAACNAGARLNDFVIYPSTTMAYHPAVPFYVFSWLAAFAAIGSGAIGADLPFFDRLIGNAPVLFASLKACGIVTTGLLVLVCWRSLVRLAPTAIVLLALALYFAVTPQAMFRAVYPLTETFALAVTALFTFALVRFAVAPLGWWPHVFAGLACAFAYLLKVSFLFVYCALLVAFFYVALFGAYRQSALWARFVLSHAVGITVICAVGFLFIGQEYFSSLLRLHWAILTHGAGSEANGSLADVFGSIAVSWRSGATAIPIVLLVAPAQLLAVIVGTKTGRIPPATATIAVGASIAALGSVAAVLTRFGDTYVLAVAATIPLLCISAWLLAGSRSARSAVGAVAACLALGSAWRSVPAVRELFLDKTEVSFRAEADMATIHQRMRPDAKGLFLYRVSMPGYGKGYVSMHCGVPGITAALLKADRPEQSSMARTVRDPDYVIADKGYNYPEAVIRSGKNLDPINLVATTWRDGDEIVPLADAWLIIRRVRTSGSSDK